MAGDPDHPAAEGPAVLTGALATAGYRLPVSRVVIPPFTGDVRSASAGVNRRVLAQVRTAVEAGNKPVVVAGSCDVAPGILAGLGETTCGVVWIDAHADFNTPQTSASGFWPGMTLAVVVGDCGRDALSSPDTSPVPADRIALLGVRSLSPEAEALRLSRSAVQVVGWHQGTPKGRFAQRSTVWSPIRLGCTCI